VSYQEFCENEEYSSLFESGAKAQIVWWGLLWRWFYGSREIKGLSSYELIFDCLIENSVEETYHNADQLFPNLSEQSNILYKLQSWEVLWKEERDLLCFYLDDIKFSVTKNRYFYKIFDEWIWRDAKLITPFWKSTLETNDWILSKSEKKILREKVNFVQVKKEHQIVEYLLFVTLTTNLDLFLVVNPVCNEFIITSADRINSVHRWTVGLFACVSKDMRWFIKYSSLQFLDQIKSKYDFSNEEDNELFIRDLLEIIKKSPSSKIQINASNWTVKDLSFSNRDQDLESYGQLKDFKRGERGVTRMTWMEEHWTKKNAVVTTWKIKYWKKWTK
jgi:hypothetical protein